MRHTYKVTYKVTNGDVTECWTASSLGSSRKLSLASLRLTTLKHGGYDPRFPLGERIILHGYVHAHDIQDAWEKARKKFGDVRNVE